MIHAFAKLQAAIDRLCLNAMTQTRTQHILKDCRCCASIDSRLRLSKWLSHSQKESLSRTNLLYRWLA